MHSIVLMAGDLDSDDPDNAEGDVYIIGSSLTPTDSKDTAREILRLLINAGFRVVQAPEDGDAKAIADIVARNTPLTLDDIVETQQAVWPA